MSYQEVTYEFPHEKSGKKAENDVDISGSSMKPLFGDDGDVAVEDDNQEPENKPAARKESESTKDEIEVYDDRPEEDRGHQRSKRDDDGEEASEDDLAQYSQAVQSRIKKLTKKYHDERRDREQALRERTELERFARSMVEENKKLKAGSGKSNKALLDSAQKLVSTEINSAKSEYQAALDAGNSEEIVKAEEKLANARAKKLKLDNIRLPTAEAPTNSQETGQTPEREVQQPQQPQQPARQPDTKAAQWAENNPWFNEDKAMTGFALGYHQELVANDVDPTSDEYYEKLNARMREVFPDKFEGEAAEEETPRKSRQPVVAPVNRSTSPKKYRLSKSQAAIARRLGVSLEDYAKQMALLEGAG